jgi:hypothetical protein
LASSGDREGDKRAGSARARGQWLKHRRRRSARCRDQTSPPSTLYSVDDSLTAHHLFVQGLTETRSMIPKCTACCKFWHDLKKGGTPSDRK